ncbi:MAG: hypothetical protein K8I00_01350 [Candidatus Omnitrophica bacterium]|nr:hypothetical protein [Candidatus Omnitrophota bacterium]
MTRSSTDYYYHLDGLGNVRQITNSSGTIVESYDYDPYGQTTIYDSSLTDITSSGSGVGNPYMFTGRRYDEESGIYYYRRRSYDPEIGRFLQRDPLGYHDSMNLFEYVVSNPINYVDPFGLLFFGDGGEGQRPNTMWAPRGGGGPTSHIRPVYWHGMPIPFVGHRYIKFSDGSTVALNRKDGKTWVGPEGNRNPDYIEEAFGVPIETPEEQIKENAEELKDKTDPNEDDVGDEQYDKFGPNSNDAHDMMCGYDMTGPFGNIK